MSKYAPLGQRLSRLKTDEWRATFAELERVLGTALPAAARSKAAWWMEAAGERAAHAKTWLEAGWKVQAVDLKNEAVEFIRVKGEAAKQTVRAKAEAADAALREHPMAAVGATAVAAFAGGVALGYMLMQALRPPPEPVPEVELSLIANAEARARRALEGLVAGLHDVEDIVSERIRRLRG